MDRQRRQERSMRHLIDVLLRVGRTEEERDALRGDLEEAYRTRVRPSRWWIGAQAWYAREVLTALACAVRDSVGVPKLKTGLTEDVRYALRRWRRRPGFALMSILTLALGIAAATATFSVVDAVLLRPLPWKDAGRLVYIHGVYPDRRSNPATAPAWNRGLLSYPAWDALRTTSAFEEVAVWRAIGRMDMTFGENRDDLVRVADVSSNFLPMMGVELVLGRYFTEREDNVNNDSILLTYETWQHRFGGRQDVIGERVPLGSASAGGRYAKTVVGVLERGFRFEGDPPEILLPVGISADTSRRYPSGTFRVVARLAPGESREQAEASAESLVSATRTAEPVSARLVALEDEHLGSARRPLWLLFGGAGVLLLIACSNVAGILLGEARARRHEVAVRTALGSGLARLLRQIGVEHTMLAVLGLGLGLAFAYWLIGVVIATAPEGLPRIDAVRLDARAVAFAVVASLLTLLLFGVAPAVTLARTPIASTLAEGGREAAASRVIGQRLVVVVQLALALVLLTGAGLFAETMRRLTSQPLGFDATDVAVLSTTFTGPRWDPERFKAIRASIKASGESDMTMRIRDLNREFNNSQVDRVLERLRGIPGIGDVSGASAVPFVLNSQRLSVVLEGRPEAERHDALRQIVTGGYFTTMRLPLLRGRLFNVADRGQPEAVVVSREFERRFFPSGALHRQFKQVYGAKYELSIPFQVVGVVEDVKRQEFSDDDRPAFYAFDRHAGGITQFLFRSAGDPVTVFAAARAAIRDLDPRLVVTSTTLLEERVAGSVAEERFRAVLSAAFGVSALLLAAVGLYGVISRRTADRRREFGVRVALGARPADVGGLVLRDAIVLFVCGLALGLPAAYAAAQVTTSLLYGVSPSSPSVFALAVLVLGLITLAASFLPTRRASVADPVAALRS
jgi:predicted permease